MEKSVVSIVKGTDAEAMEFDCVLAGRDMVAIDATACRMAGLSLDQVEYFDAARAKGLGTFDAKQIEVRGERIDDVQRNLYLPYLDGFDAWPEYNFHIEKACSTCQGLLSFTMSKLKSLNECDENMGIHIVLGRHKKIPDDIDFGPNLVLLGDCTEGLRKRLEQAGKTCLHVPRCPPAEPLPAWMIVERGEPPAAHPAGLRARHIREEEIFREWLKKQVRS